ncbi:hypothetical protein [Paraglaciecola sp. L3A3]|uniref:hypothetical protein n=1 Tax=Paraglaciecola sp. L3A3 TaxID=2686358 RepID=UPI00131B8D87|nr:hypothetical protein [Paraglaciecola sp. L3A3]
MNKLLSLPRVLNMNLQVSLTALLASIICLSACTSSFYEIEYSAISTKNSLKKLTGQTCTIAQSWYLIGWQNFDNNGVIESYTLKPSDNVSSRHIKDQIKLDSNLKIKVLTIEQNSNWKLLVNKYKVHWQVENIDLPAHSTFSAGNMNNESFDLCFEFTK